MVERYRFWDNPGSLSSSQNPGVPVGALEEHFQKGRSRVPPGVRPRGATAFREEAQNKPPRETLEKVIEKQMPGYKIAPKKKPTAASRDSSSRPDSDTPDIATLRRKYLRRRTRDRQTSEGATGNPARDTGQRAGGIDDAIVAVEPKDRSRDGQLPGGGRSKRVVISGDTNEIIGRQG